MEKMVELISHYNKNSFLSTLLPKTHSTRLSLYAAATLCKKTQKKFHAV